MEAIPEAQVWKAPLGRAGQRKEESPYRARENRSVGSNHVKEKKVDTAAEQNTEPEKHARSPTGLEGSHYAVYTKNTGSRGSEVSELLPRRFFHSPVLTLCFWLPIFHEGNCSGPFSHASLPGFAYPEMAEHTVWATTAVFQLVSDSAHSIIHFQKPDTLPHSRTDFACRLSFIGPQAFCF